MKTQTRIGETRGNNGARNKVIKWAHKEEMKESQTRHIKTRQISQEANLPLEVLVTQLSTTLHLEVVIMLGTALHLEVVTKDLDNINKGYKRASRSRTTSTRNTRGQAEPE
jgi:hypothetical protein